MAFLCLSSSLLVSALRPFPTWVDISQQCLMYIWPLMLSLRVPEPEAQLKLTTLEALPPALIPTLPQTHPLSLAPLFVSPITFPLLHTSSQLVSSCPLATVHLCSSLSSSFTIQYISYPSSLSSFICSIPLTTECLHCFAVSSSFSIVTWQSVIYGHTDFAFPPIWVIVVLETSELQFQHIAHFLSWYMVCFVEARSRPHLFHLNHIQ